MANIKISPPVPIGLPAAAAANGGELIPCDQTIGGVVTTVKITSASIAALAASTLSITDGTTTVAGVTSIRFNGGTISGTSPNGIVTIAAGGVSSVTGTANQITATPTTGAVVLSLSPNVVIPAPATGVTLNVQRTGDGTSIQLDRSGVASAQIGFGNAFAAGQFELFSIGTVPLGIGASGAAALNLYTQGSSRISISSGGIVTINAVGAASSLVVIGNTTATMIQSENLSTGSALAQHMSLSNFNDADFNVWVTQVGATSKSCQIGPTVPIPIVFLGTGLVGSGATGGGQGIGTGNFTGVFVNGVAVGNPITSNHVSTAVPLTSTTTLTAVPQLVTASLATGTYEFEAFMVLTEVTTGTGGFKCDFAGGGATISSIVGSSIQFIAALAGATFNATTSVTTLTTVATSAPGSWVQIKGSITVSVAGTFGIRAAQTVSSANATSINVGSYIKLTKIT